MIHNILIVNYNKRSEVSIANRKDQIRLYSKSKDVIAGSKQATWRNSYFKFKAPTKGNYEFSVVIGTL